MNRTLRGVWARRATLLPLLLLSTVVVAGVVAVIALAESTRTSPAVVVPLLVLGLVAVPDTGRHLAATRRGEIAVGRLRGVTGGQLYAVLAIEPLLVLTAGALLGVGLGAATAAAASRVWFGAPAPIGVTVLPAVALVVAVGLAAVLVGMSGRLREPLGEQVSIAERPRPATTASLFLSVLVLVAAVVATYRATVVTATDPGWVVLAAPALVGLAVGQLTVWLIRLGAGLAVRRTASAGLPTFLAARRLARVARAADPIRLLVAAAVVAAVSVTAALQVTDWTRDTARIRAAAPFRVDVDGDVTEALALAAELDPDGRWLMAAAVVPGEGSVPARRGFVDTARYDAVVGDFLAGTPAAAASARVAELVPDDRVASATGDTLRVSVRGVSRRVEGTLRPDVTVGFLDAQGQQAERTAHLSIPRDGSPVTTTIPLAPCRAGCTLTQITLRRGPGDAPLPYVVTRLEFAGENALAGEWRSTERAPFGQTPGPVEVDDGLMMAAAPPSQRAVPDDAGAGTPILATDSATWEGPPLLDSPGGDERPATVVGHWPALPLVEADGVLADLHAAAAGALPTVPAAEVMVLAGAGTPRATLDALVERTGTTVDDLHRAEDATTLEAGGTQAYVYALIAGFCLVLALLVLASAAGRQRVEQRRHTAALRVVGVGPGQLRGSSRRELGVLALGVVAATLAGSVIGVALLLANLALVTVPPHAVPLRVGVATIPLAAAALSAAALVLLVGGRARAVRAEESRPAILREADR